MDDLIKELLEELKALDGEKDFLADLKKAKLSESEVAHTQAAFRLLGGVAEKLTKAGVTIKAFAPAPEKIKPDLTTTAEFLKAAKTEQRQEIAKAMGVDPAKFVQAFEDKKPEPGALLKADGTLNLDAIPESLRPAMQVLLKDGADTKAKLEKAEKDIAKEKEDKSKKEWLAKADEFKDLPGVDIEKLATTLSKLDAVDHEAAENMQKQLRADLELIEKGEVFTERGRRGAPAGGTAIERVNTMAHALVQKNDKMTEEDALTKVLADNPRLYDEYKKETEFRA